MPKSSNPAVDAADAALAETIKCIEAKKSFVLEAGAGAGKTYSLVECLKHVIEHEAGNMRSAGQQAACITFTNVATNEIRERIDSHPAIFVGTLHEFFWGLIAKQQKELRRLIPGLGGQWDTLLEEHGGVEGKQVEYSQGYRAIKKNKVTLYHDDVIALAASMMAIPKFVAMMRSQYPIIFIDEYQDTNLQLAKALCEHVVKLQLVGFFGDSWQQIYDTGCGSIDTHDIEYISQASNFRSGTLIIESLNRFRTELPQSPASPERDGQVHVFHTNDYATESRLTRSPHSGDLSNVDKPAAVSTCKSLLEKHGWDWALDTTRVLVLTNKSLTEDTGFQQLASCFKRKEGWTKLEHAHLDFFVSVLIPASLAYRNGRYGEMFDLFQLKKPLIRDASDKKAWAELMTYLAGLENESVGQVMAAILASGLIPLPKRVEEQETLLEGADEEMLAATRSLQELKKLHGVPYSQLQKLFEYSAKETLVSTKHGVKGAEFENVLIILGRGWNNYDWSGMLEWHPTSYPAAKEKIYFRSRNLFYVACSRAKERMCLLFTQELSDEALETVSEIFGSENVRGLTSTNLSKSRKTSGS